VYVTENRSVGGSIPPLGTISPLRYSPSRSSDRGLRIRRVEARQFRIDLDRALADCSS
jgi:hypothetical protein